MTDTARAADIVLPATMFLEHDDIYTGGGHQYLQFGPKTIEPPEGCRSNHEVIVGLAERLGARHPSFSMSPREIIDWTLRASRRGTLAELEEKKWLDCQPSFEEAHFLNGFAYPDGKFRLRADWAATPFSGDGLKGPWREMPALPDHWAINEMADDAHPFKLATSPARNFLNSSFTETPTSRAREQRPTALMNGDDVVALGLSHGDIVRLGNARGQIRLHLKVFAGLPRGLVICEGVWPPSAFLDGRGVNVLIGDDSVAPFGGAAFHDARVWARGG
jgi:anaerobic selenocysteine-containing dehydrogenase